MLTAIHYTKELYVVTPWYSVQLLYIRIQVVPADVVPEPAGDQAVYKLVSNVQKLLYYYNYYCSDENNLQPSFGYPIRSRDQSSLGNFAIFATLKQLIKKVAKSFIFIFMLYMHLQKAYVAKIKLANSQAQKAPNSLLANISECGQRIFAYGI